MATQLSQSGHRMIDIHARLDESVDYVRKLYADTPVAGIVLGSGLSSLSESLEEVVALDGDIIPHYPRATAPGHRGRLLFGKLAGLPVCLIDGRFHRYEGHDFDTIVYPVRLMIALGIQTLVVSNAAGAVNQQFHCGDIVILDDHINMMWGSPLRDSNDERLGPRFPDMSCPYDPQLARQARTAAAAEGLQAHRGIYLALSGPTYETPAEYRMVRKLGADVVGMSTVPEVIAARHAGIRVLGFSVVSNVAMDGAIESVSSDDVLATVASVAPAIGRVVTSVLASEPSS
ncbi:MAG: purine-nucleoside phosphorylase [Planctomycetota bacterium]|nr:purine-nucleoside phosphorylase [Planctomycetota bacterium]MDA1158164.1 purine-nucleoside phosphorylase [Planctomycetota bacterium]